MWTKHHDFLRQVKGGLLDLIYPSCCVHSGVPINRYAVPPLSLKSYARLERTGHWLLKENGLTDRLAGRLPLVFGAAYYHFAVDSPIQSLIHALKYYHRPEIGEQLGRDFARHLAPVDRLEDLTGIVPVPIHPTRRRERGYNQAEHIAKGLSDVLGVPIYPNALRRTEFRGSQTKLTAEERLENVRKAFGVGAGNFAGGHLLLVDDVLTTGATLDFCGQLLLEHHPGVRLSVATLAVAN